MKTQTFTGTLADKAVQLNKLVVQQQQRPKVMCESNQLKNKFRFKYLGTIFTADANQTHDINARIAQAQQRHGTLRHLFNSPDLTTALKLRLYSAAVCSIITYGCETWNLNGAASRRINGANSRMLAHITGRSIQQEARSATTSLDIVKRMRKIRLRWLGQILKGDNRRLIFQAVKHQHLNMKNGNILMDVPPLADFNDLILLARDQVQWSKLIANI